MFATFLGLYLMRTRFYGNVNVNKTEHPPAARLQPKVLIRAETNKGRKQASAP